MTRKDLFNEWERQEPLELDKEKLGTAFSKVLKKIDSVESVMENEKSTQEIRIVRLPESGDIFICGRGCGHLCHTRVHQCVKEGLQPRPLRAYSGNAGEYDGIFNQQRRDPACHFTRFQQGDPQRWFRAHLPGTVRGRRKGGVPER